MARDYKGYSNNSTRKKSSKNKQGLLWFIIIVLMMGLGYGLYSLKQQAKKTLPVSKPAQKMTVPKTPEEQPIKFEFYNLLPKDQVVVSDNAVKTTLPPKPVVNAVPPQPVAMQNATMQNSTMQNATMQNTTMQNKYLLQIISLKNFADADKIKANLLLNGFSVQIRSTINNNITWHRVEVGPYTSLQEAQDAQQKLRDNHFSAMIKKYNP